MPRAESIADDEGGLVRRVREFLIEKATVDLARLPEGIDAYEFGVDRDRLQRRLADLEAGAPVTFYGWQLRGALRPPGMEGRTLYTASRGGIAPAVYERADGTVR